MTATKMTATNHVSDGHSNAVLIDMVCGRHVFVAVIECRTLILLVLWTYT